MFPRPGFVGPKAIVNEFFRTSSYELDFKVEANNMAKIAENMTEFPDIVIPRVFKQLELPARADAREAGRNSGQ